VFANSEQTEQLEPSGFAAQRDSKKVQTTGWNAARQENQYPQIRQNP